MKFSYKPEGADEARVWDFDPNHMKSREMIAVERLTGMTWPEWIDACSRGSMVAVHALLYVLLKRDVPALDPDQVEFELDEIDFVVDDEPAPKDSKKATKRSGSSTSSPSSDS